MARLRGKTAIITGAASGFGEGIATRFAEEGAHVVVADLNHAGAENVARAIGDRAIAVTADVSKEADIRACVDAALRLTGKVDILVNNAGFIHRNGPLAEVDEHVFDLIHAVNNKAIYFAAKAVVPIMRQQGGGVILSTASTAAMRPRPGLAWYNASKAWVVNATRSMAIELAPDNIRVNCLCPVAGETGMLPQFLDEETPEARERFRQSIPLGRLSTPGDIASAALWLASDEADFITGVALEVDGGRSI